VQVPTRELGRDRHLGAQYCWLLLSAALIRRNPLRHGAFGHIRIIVRYVAGAKHLGATKYSRLPDFATNAGAQLPFSSTIAY